MKPPATVNVFCPRCDEPIVCTLQAETPPPKPGHKPSRDLKLRIPDLAERFAEHYRTAGHVA